MATEKKTLGKLPLDAFRTLSINRLPAEITQGFANLTDLTGAVSDAMDNLGLCAAIPASELRPILPGRRIVGHAVTVRNVQRQQSVFSAARERISNASRTSMPGLRSAW